MLSEYIRVSDCHQCEYCDNIIGEVKLPYLGEVGTEEFLQKLTTQITEMVSAKFTQGKRKHNLDHFQSIILSKYFCNMHYIQYV